MKKNIMKILLFAICITCMMTLFAGCANNQANGNQTILKSSEEYIAFEKTGEPFQYFVDKDFKSAITIILPECIKNKYSTMLSSDFDAGYCELTFVQNGTDTNNTARLFTIYCSKDKRYEEYKNEKNYQILGSDETYTFIWFEPAETKADQEVIKAYDYIKASFTTK